jgi:hypothetical protein
VIRADFDYREDVMRIFPATFTLPARFTRRRMVVADFARGDAGGIADASVAAWTLLRRAVRNEGKARCATA